MCPQEQLCTARRSHVSHHTTRASRHSSRDRSSSYGEVSASVMQGTRYCCTSSASSPDAGANLGPSLLGYSEVTIEVGFVVDLALAGRALGQAEEVAEERCVNLEAHGPDCFSIHLVLLALERPDGERARRSDKAGRQRRPVVQPPVPVTLHFVHRGLMKARGRARYCAQVRLGGIQNKDLSHQDFEIGKSRL
jgi:hypothetical protein